MDNPDSLKWLSGVIGVLSLPFAWIHTRQNRMDDAINKIAENAKNISESVARMETHQEHIIKDLDEIKSIHKRRRKHDG